MQAGGRRFEPDRLQKQGSVASARVSDRCWWRAVGSGGIAGKRGSSGGGPWAGDRAGVTPRGRAAGPAVRGAGCVRWRLRPAAGVTGGFFVRVNQVLVRLWTRLSGVRGASAARAPACMRRHRRVRGVAMSDRFACVGFALCGRPATGAKAFRGVCFVLSEAWPVVCGVWLVWLDGYRAWRAGRRLGRVAGSAFRRWCGGVFGWAPGVLERNKGIRWMPWHQEAMKDVARCEKPWGAASRR